MQKIIKFQQIILKKMMNLYLKKNWRQKIFKMVKYNEKTRIFLMII